MPRSSAKIQKNVLSWTRQQGPICIRINQRPFWNKVYCIFCRPVSWDELCFKFCLANCGVIYKTETKWQIPYGFKRNRTPWLHHIVYSVVWQFAFICTQLWTVFREKKNQLEMWQPRIIWKRSWRLFFASLFKEKVLHGNGLILKFILVIWHDWFSCLHARNEIGRGFCFL